MPPADAVLAFLTGYAGLLTAPAATILAVGGLAAVRGTAGAWPLCIGLALGAGMLAMGTAMMAALGHAPDPDGVLRTGRILGALMLVPMALSVLQGSPAAEAEDSRRPAGYRFERAMALGAGFVLALSNPAAAAFLAAQFRGPLSGAVNGLGPVIVGYAIAFVALGFFMLIALLLSRPRTRRALMARERLAQLGAAAALLLCASTILWQALDA